MKTSERLRDLQYRLEYAVLRLVAGFFRALPLNVATERLGVVLASPGAHHQSQTP